MWTRLQGKEQLSLSICQWKRGDNRDRYNERVLILGNEADVRECLAGYFDDHALLAPTAESREDTLEPAASEKPDTTLIDIQFTERS